MAQVAAAYDQFQQQDVQVVTLSFVGEPFLSAWREETGSPFPMFVDESRGLYGAYGLTRSAVRSWGVRNLWYYAKAVANGRELYGKRGDTNQLAGNFIVDGQGVVCYAHASRYPTDRPRVGELLTSVQ